MNKVGCSSVVLPVGCVSHRRGRVRFASSSSVIVDRLALKLYERGIKLTKEDVGMCVDEAIYIEVKGSRIQAESQFLGL